MADLPQFQSDEFFYESNPPIYKDELLLGQERAIALTSEGNVDSSEIKTFTADGNLTALTAIVAHIVVHENGSLVTMTESREGCGLGQDQSNASPSISEEEEIQVTQAETNSLAECLSNQDKDNADPESPPIFPEDLKAYECPPVVIDEKGEQEIAAVDETPGECVSNQDEDNADPESPPLFPEDLRAFECPSTVLIKRAKQEVPFRDGNMNECDSTPTNSLEMEHYLLQPTSQVGISLSTACHYTALGSPNNNIDEYDTPELDFRGENHNDNDNYNLQACLSTSQQSKNNFLSLDEEIYEDVGAYHNLGLENDDNCQFYKKKSFNPKSTVHYKTRTDLSNVHGDRRSRDRYEYPTSQVPDTISKATPTAPDVIYSQPGSYLKPRGTITDVEILYHRSGDRLIYDFEKIAVCWGQQSGLNLEVEDNIPQELLERGILPSDWSRWIRELRDTQTLSPTYSGLACICCFPGFLIQTLFCSLCCPISYNHPLTCLPCCYGDWHKSLEDWMRRVNRTLNRHGMHAKFLTHRPPPDTAISKNHTDRVKHKPKSCYEMSFLVISLTVEESAKLQKENWAHGTDYWFMPCLGRNI